MRLHYDKSVSADPRPLILLDEAGERVELHIRQDEDGTVTLLAFAGRDGEAPEKTTQQGPFHVYDQAVAARRAIAWQLKEAGFDAAPQQQPLWSMAVQRSIKATREEKQGFSADYRFDPKDVYLDW